MRSSTTRALPASRRPPFTSRRTLSVRLPAVATVLVACLACASPLSANPFHSSGPAPRPAAQQAAEAEALPADQNNADIDSAAQQPADAAALPADQNNADLADIAAADQNTANASSNSSRSVLPVRASSPDRRLVSRQLDVRTRLGQYLSGLKESDSPALFWSMLAAAFAYGILHALGPGHRKTVVFSYYLTRPAPVWEPAALAALLSLLHGGAAIVLLGILRGVSGSLAGRADNIGVYMEGFSYLFLAVAAFALAVHSVFELFSRRHKRISGALSIGMILLSGIYPCPGAILVLVLSIALDISAFGIAAVLAMSIGMSLPITAAGYLAWFGRTGVFLALKKNETLVGRVSHLIELSGYLVLLAFSVWISLPFASSLASALFRR